MNFKDRVISIVKKIPYGRVTTYGTVAVLAGLPRGARLVGGVLHFNIDEAPWHRVVNRHGFISTKCLDHPKHLQKVLLEQEAVVVSKDFMINLQRYGLRDMNKTIWIIANWKSNKTIAEALDWISKVGPSLPKRDTLKVVVCPTFSALSEVKKAVLVGNYPLMVGSQDLSPHEPGAYTGEEAAQILKQFVDLSILGHSERRQNFKETDGMVLKKVEQSLQNNIIPLVCVQGADTPVPQGCKLVAYEPVFAIGTGNPDTPENANQIAGNLKEKYGLDLEVLYGGSVTSQNIKEFILQENISGVLVGKSSLEAQEFIKTVKEC